MNENVSGVVTPGYDSMMLLLSQRVYSPRVGTFSGVDTSGVDTWGGLPSGGAGRLVMGRVCSK